MTKQESLANHTGWLTLHFQPIYDITGETPALYGYESLLRVQTGEIVESAEEIVLEAERSNAIISIDSWVLHVVAGIVKSQPHTRISINASQRSIESTHYLTAAFEILGACSPSPVAIEVTETAAVDQEKLATHLELLHLRAIPIILDDVLDGHAQIDLLKRTFVSGCKISRKSTSAVRHCRDTWRCIAEVVARCREQGKLVVMEGIESEEELNLAKKLGVRYCQGYYFEKPRDSETLFGIPGALSRVRDHF